MVQKIPLFKVFYTKVLGGDIIPFSGNLKHGHLQQILGDFTGGGQGIMLLVCDWVCLLSLGDEITTDWNIKSKNN